MDFRKATLILVLAIGMLPVNSCKDDAEEPQPSAFTFTAEKTDVKTYEIVTIETEAYIVTEKYEGTFGGQSVDLIKTSDSTLSFFVPDVAAGSQHLDFELATLTFNVTKTPEGNPDDIVTTVLSNFDSGLTSLDPATAEDSADVEELKQYKLEVLTLFNSLTTEQKRQAALFYQANKETFQTFASEITSTIDAASTLGRQSDCPKTNFKEFYSCTAQNLGTASYGLAKASKEFIRILALTGTAAALAPASFGFSATAVVLGLGTAGYLLMTEVLPAARKFKWALRDFLKVNWIFGKNLFLVIVDEFNDNEDTDLQLQPTYSSYTESDAAISEEMSTFDNAMSSLATYWNKLTALFGQQPVPQSTEESASLSASDIEISNISNPYVGLVSQNGQHVTFESKSGGEENFGYHIRVTKEGFVKEMDVNAKINAFDSTQLYTDSMLGTYILTPTTSDGSTFHCELQSNGSAKYMIYNSPSWPDGYVFYAKWDVVKHNGRYYYEESIYNSNYTGTPSGGIGIFEDMPLKEYPVNTFDYSTYTYTRM